MDRNTEREYTARLLERSFELAEQPVSGEGVAPGPAAYLLRYVGPAGGIGVNAYAPLKGSSWPIYGGSTVCIRERLWAHRRRLSRAAGLAPEHFTAVILRMPSGASAVYAEQLLLGQFRCVWNERLTGFGSAGQGSARAGQRCSAWDLMHPGRRQTSGPPLATRRDLRAAVQSHLAVTVGIWAEDLGAVAALTRL